MFGIGEFPILLADASGGTAWPRLTWDPVGGGYGVFVFLTAAVLAALLFIRPAASKVRSRRLLTLVLLRLAIVLLVVLIMLRPTLVYTEAKRLPATLIVLVDRSRSLTVPDEADDRTRWEALTKTLADARGELAALAEQSEVNVYTFDVDVHPAELVDGEIRLPDAPDGEQTAIGHAIQSVLRREAGKRLLGVILLSDGAQRALPPRDLLPHTAAGQLKSQGERLYTLRFGRARGLGQTQDLAVTDLLAAPRVFVKNELVVTGQVRADGFVNRDIPVRLLYEKSPGKMEVVAGENLRADESGQLIPFELRYVPEVPGEHKLTVEVVQQPGEMVTTNNRRSAFVHVLKGGLSVLYLEGARRPEVKFLNRALDASPDIKVDYLFPPWDLSGRFEPGKYQVYILGDLDATAFGGEELTDLAETVSGGAGLIMLGGFHSFGPGGYAETPLARVLPVRMDKLERQRYGEPLRKDLHLWEEVRMRPVPIVHFTMMLAATPQESRAIWDRLPPLTGANKFDRRLSPLAVRLAETERGQPLMVAHTYGNGRVIAFAGDSTWRWWMRGFETAHKRFWRQVVLWLARKDESLEGNIWIQLHLRRFSPGQRVDFRVEVQSPTGEPMEKVAGRADVVSPDGTTDSLDLTGHGEYLTGSFRAAETPGDYTIHARVHKDGQPLGAAKARFLVVEQDLELDNAAADGTMLDSLASMTGGQSLAPEQLPDLIERLAADTEELVELKETKKSLWDIWPLLLLVVGLLGVEWFLRKRWGLV